MSRVVVPTTRAIPSRSGVLVGEPVIAPAQWTDMAHGANWLKAKGACLVPNFSPSYEIKDASEHVFRFRVKPRLAAVQRVWTITVVLQPAAGEPESAVVLVKAPASIGTAVRGPASAVIDGIFSVFPLQTTIVETISAQSDTETEISVSVQVLTDTTAVTNSTTARVIGIQCYEQDRATLEDNTTDVATRIETVRTGEPVLRLDYSSAWGVLETVKNSDARRVGIFHFSTPSVLSQLSAVPASLFSLKPYIQAPKVARGSTTKAVYWSAYGAMSAGGGSGTVAVSTSVSGVSDSVNFTSTTPAWSTARAISIACDDFDEIDGFRADELQVTLAGDGTRSLLFNAISIWTASVA